MDYYDDYDYDYDDYRQDPRRRRKKQGLSVFQITIIVLTVIAVAFVVALWTSAAARGYVKSKVQDLIRPYAGCPEMPECLVPPSPTVIPLPDDVVKSFDEYKQYCSPSFPPIVHPQFVSYCENRADNIQGMPIKRFV